MGEVAETGFGQWHARDALEQKLERLVRGLSYQDGWSFVLSRMSDQHGGAILHVTWEVDDLEFPGQRTFLAGTVVFRQGRGREPFHMFLYDVWHMIHTLESHERLEHLRFDGEPLWNPHPAGSRGEALVSQPNLDEPLPDLGRLIRDEQLHGVHRTAW